MSETSDKGFTHWLNWFLTCAGFATGVLALILSYQQTLKEDAIDGVDHIPKVKLQLSKKQCVLENLDTHKLVNVSLNYYRWLVDPMDKTASGGNMGKTYLKSELSHRESLARDFDLSNTRLCFSRLPLRCDKLDMCISVFECRATIHRESDKKPFTVSRFVRVKKTDDNSSCEVGESDVGLRHIERDADKHMLMAAEIIEANTRRPSMLREAAEHYLPPNTEYVP